MKVIIRYWAELLIAVLAAFIIWPLLLPGYFSHHDDLQVMRIYEMRRCLQDLQIPCRWVPDMGYGNGLPLYNYYSILPYYIGAIFSYITGFIVAAKILFFIALLLGGISMYLLGKELFGKVGGVVSSVMYMLAPYRALDSYVRGALAESIAIAIIPLVFYFYTKLIKNGSLAAFLGATISLASFLTTHNIMTLFFIPLLFAYIFLRILQERKKSPFLIIASLVLGFGLSAFFIMPAFLEKSLVQTETLTRFDLDFRVHFVTFAQVFINRSWGYGASVLGPNDTISFQVGWPHWWIAPLVILMTVLNFKTKLQKESKVNTYIFFLLLVFFLASLFMMHNKSAFIWEKIGILRFAQFPWRFLSIAIFSAALIGGFFVSNLKQRWYFLATLAIIFLTVVFNISYFKPEKFDFNLTDKEKLSGENWKVQQKAGILDYLPKTALESRESAPSVPIVISGKAEFVEFENRSNRWSFKALASVPSIIEVPVFDFPNWQVEIDKQVITHSNQNYLGRIRFNLSQGDHMVVGKFTDTPIRTVANIVTLTSVVLVVLLAIYGKSKQIFR